MTKTEIRDSLVKQLELRGMNAEFYKDMIDDYVYYWSLKKSKRSIGGTLVDLPIFLDN